MYHIALCEDEAAIAEKQEKICKEILDKLNIEFTLTVFNSGTDFLAAFSHEKKRYDLILMDIIMDGKNGMELAKMIRESDREAAIVFITSSRDYAVEGYEVEALNYLIKPVDSDALERIIEKDYRRRFQNLYFMFNSRGNQIRVALKDIICMETIGRRVEVTLTNQTVYYSGKLSELLEQLPKDQFIRCHQGYGLNISNLREFSGRDAVTVNGKIIPVSRTYAKEVQKAFLRELRGE